MEGTDREVLRCVARTSLRTKLAERLADQLTDIVTDAVMTIRKPDEPIDLYMVRAPGEPLCVTMSRNAEHHRELRLVAIMASPLCSEQNVLCDDRQLL